MLALPAPIAYDFGEDCSSLNPTVVTTTRAGCYVPAPGTSVAIKCINEHDASKFVYETSNCTGPYTQTAILGISIATSLGYSQQACFTLHSQPMKDNPQMR